MSKRPSQQNRGPSPKEMTVLEDVNQRIFDLNRDMDSAFEHLAKLENDYEDLCKRSISPEDADDLNKRVQFLEHASKVLENDLGIVEREHGHDRSHHRRRVLTHAMGKEDSLPAQAASAAGDVAGQAGSILSQGPTAVEEQAEHLGKPSSPEGIHKGVLTGLDKAAGCGWTRAPRVPEIMERKVLNELYRMAQDRAGVVVSARNAVDIFTGLLEGINTNPTVKAVEKALGPFALPGESLDQTAARISNVANKMSDPVKTVMGECKNVRTKLNAVMERLRGHDLEGVEDRIAGLNRTAEKMASDVEEIGLQFMSIDSLPTAVEGLDKSLEDITKLTTDSSVVFEVKTPEHSAHVWSIYCPGHPPQMECETCGKKAKDLNAALSRAIEAVLVWTLKEGAGFKKHILGRNIEQAMTGIIYPAISVTGIDGSCVKEVTDYAKHELDEYFGMVY